MVALAILVAGCSDAEAPVEREKTPRPVTVLVLKSTNPQRSTQLTGSVASWKTEQIGFQVAGRVERVLEPGQEIEGRTFDENGEVIEQGQATVIAELEKDRYDLQLAVAQAQKKTAIAKAQAKQSELENVVPQLIRAALAAVTLAKEDFARVEKLFNQKAAS